MESTLVPVFLQKFLLSFGLFFPEFLGPFQVFLQPLFFRKGSPSLNFLPLLFPKDFLLLLFLDPSKLTQSPSFKFPCWIQPIGVINIWYEFLFFLCRHTSACTIENMTKTISTFGQLSLDTFSYKIVALFPAP